MELDKPGAVGRHTPSLFLILAPGEEMTPTQTGKQECKREGFPGVPFKALESWVPAPSLDFQVVRLMFCPETSTSLVSLGGIKVPTQLSFRLKRPSYLLMYTALFFLKTQL